MDEQPTPTRGIRVSRAMMEHTARAEEFATQALRHQESVRKNHKAMREEFQQERRRTSERLQQLEAQVALLTDGHALMRAAFDRLLATMNGAGAQDAPRTLLVKDRPVNVSHVDALPLFGALAMALDGETARITLASGDVLELTHQDVSHIGRQLAGKPADEVSG